MKNPKNKSTLQVVRNRRRTEAPDVLNCAKSFAKYCSVQWINSDSVCAPMRQHPLQTTPMPATVIILSIARR